MVTDGLDLEQHMVKDKSVREDVGVSRGRQGTHPF